MKKLIRNKGTVHPSPAPLSDKLSFLPAAILTLMVALSPEEKEVLAYLISSPATSNFPGNRKTTHKSAVPGKSGDHSPYFNCNCFECYMSYWVKWDSSPNHQLIHEIIDAFEDGLAQNKTEKNKRERRKRRCGESGELKRSELSPGKSELAELVDKRETSDVGDGDGDCDGDEGYEKSSVRKFVSFLGERIWSVWT